MTKLGNVIETTWLFVCASLRFPVAITGSRGSERSVRIWNVEVTRDTNVWRIVL